jgi:DNA-directed RNA polymerase subunit H (RpoH/RPB5)|tara:strand:+ start:674 stop:850 length:177 start_codon:yes stop_codon:yes gene_type:complete
MHRLYLKLTEEESTALAWAIKYLKIENDSLPKEIQMKENVIQSLENKFNDNAIDTGWY